MRNGASTCRLHEIKTLELLSAPAEHGRNDGTGRGQSRRGEGGTEGVAETRRRRTLCGRRALALALVTTGETGVRTGRGWIIDGDGRRRERVRLILFRTAHRGACGPCAASTVRRRHPRAASKPPCSRGRRLLPPSQSADRRELRELRELRRPVKRAGQSPAQDFGLRLRAPQRQFGRRSATV